MNEFTYKDNQFYCEGVPVQALAEKQGTPLYIYSQHALAEAFRQLDGALSFVPHQICFSVKSNSNIAICRLLANEGACFDIVSGGEFYRVLKAGVDPSKVVFAGVGKKESEIELALKNKILFFTVESGPELKLIAQVAQRLKTKGAIAIRVNPDVDPKTHKYITTGKGENKFGLDVRRARKLYKEAAKLSSIEIVGIQMHIGSQITTLKPYEEALNKMIPLINELREQGITLKYLDIGGGLGITYSDEKPPSAQQFAEAIRPFVEHLGLTILLEPGRFIAGNAGILVTQVTYLKETPSKNFLIVDAGMNDLIRPSLYEAYHEIVPVKNQNQQEMNADIVGPICETGDFFAKDRKIATVEPGDLLVIKSAGAYAFSMASNYNTRPRAAEVLVNGAEYAVIRERETVEQLVAGETIPAWL